MASKSTDLNPITLSVRNAVLDPVYCFVCSGLFCPLIRLRIWQPPDQNNRGLLQTLKRGAFIAEAQLPWIRGIDPRQL